MMIIECHLWQCTGSTASTIWSADTMTSIGCRSVEAGKRNISLQNIYKIAEGFNISVSALFVVVEKMNTEELEKR